MKKLLQLRFFYILVFIFCVCVFSGCDNSLPDNATLKKMALENSLKPIKRGGNGVAYWNKFAKAFMFCPAFDFKKVGNATEYEFIAECSDNKIRKFVSSKPEADLSPIWLDIPTGKVFLSVVAKNNSQTLSIQTREFYKSASFSGINQKPKCSYRQSAKKALKYLFESPMGQCWLKDGKPNLPKTKADDGYWLYCYPSKMGSKFIDGMLLYAKLEPSAKDDALKIACKVADYLISISQPKDAPLAFMPPTYVESIHPIATKYLGENMMIYPAHVGEAYLNLAEETNNKKYFQAAVNIADSYLKTQLSNGSWYLKIYEKDGKSVDGILMNPVDVLDFLNRIAVLTKNQEYAKAVLKAEEYTIKTNLKDFVWSGQFEDVEPAAGYKNLSKHPAIRLMLYLMKKYPDNAELMSQMRSVADFCEDQFVMWESYFGKPEVKKGKLFDKNFTITKWQKRFNCDIVYPLAMEQYSYYVPIDASAAALLKMYIAMYKKFGDKLDLAKAHAFATVITHIQNPNGSIPTYWGIPRVFSVDHKSQAEGWINCAIATAITQYEFSKIAESSDVLKQK